MIILLSLINLFQIKVRAANEAALEVEKGAQRYSPNYWDQPLT